MTEKLILEEVITTNNKYQDFLGLLLLAISETLCLSFRESYEQGPAVFFHKDYWKQTWKKFSKFFL